MTLTFLQATILFGAIHGLILAMLLYFLPKFSVHPASKALVLFIVVFSLLNQVAKECLQYRQACQKLDQWPSFHRMIALWFQTQLLPDNIYNNRNIKPPGFL